MEFSGPARQTSLISRETPSLQRISIIPLRASPIAHAQYGTHLQDVFGRRRVHFEAKAQKPTDTDIAKAARRALENQRREQVGPRNVASRLSAKSLAQVFKAFGGRIVRRQTPIDLQGGGVIYVDSGPFFSLLGKGDRSIASAPC